LPGRTRVGRLRLPSRVMRSGSCRITVSGSQGRLEIAAEGDADRRSAKNASAGMHQSREAHLAELAPLPRGGMTRENGAPRRRGGTRVAGIGISVEIRVGISVAVNRLGHGGPGSGPPGLRSLPAKPHTPKACPSRPPTVAGTPWSRAVVKGEWPAGFDLRGGGEPDIRP
jgi:hypothetical protein